MKREAAVLNVLLWVSLGALGCEEDKIPPAPPPPEETCPPTCPPVPVPEPKAPVVLRTEPALEAVEVDVLPSLTIAFSEAMDARFLKADTFTLRSGDVPLEGTVSVEGNRATFQPTRRLALLGHHSASIAAGVLSTEGVALTQGYQWDFRVRDGRWKSTPGPLSRPGEQSLTPQIAVGAAGQALALWSEPKGEEEFLWFSEYAPGTGWTEARKLEPTRTSPGSYFRAKHPQVVMDSQGGSLAVWLQSESSFISTPWFSRYTAGKGWEPARPLDPAPSGDASIVQLAIDKQDRVVAIWAQFDADTSIESIWASRYVPSEGWGRAQRIDTSGYGWSLEPQLSMGADGHAVAAWYRFDDVHHAVWVSRYTPGQGWSAAENVSGEDPEAFYAEPIAGPGGSMLVLWSQLEGNDVQLWSRRHVPGQGWEAAYRLEERLGTSGAAQAALDARGHALVVWPRFDGQRTRLAASRYVFDEGWETTGQFESLAEGNAVDPQVAVDTRGHGLAVWEQEGTQGSQVAASRYVLGEGWGAVSLLGTTKGVKASTPQVALGADGQGAAVWLQAFETESHVAAGRFE